MTLPAATRAILFDFDGTLAPNLDLPDMRRQVIQLTHSYDVPAAVYEGLYIVEVIDAAAAWLRSRGHPMAAAYHTQAHQLITDIEITAAAETALFDGVQILLSRLRDAGIKSGIVTRNCRAAVLQVCPDIEELVHSLRTRSDVMHLKPDERHLQQCLDDLDCPGQSAVMVGDGQLDMRAGAALGLYCVGVLTGSGSKDALREAGADQILPSVLDLMGSPQAD